VQINSSQYQLFQEAFRQYYQPLCQYAFTLVKEPHACEDIVQEIFLRVWEKKQDLIGTEALRFYLYTAVRNNCLTHLEKIKKTVVTGLTGDEAMTPEETVPEKNPGTDFNGLVATALERLPPKCREVFVMSRLGRLTYQQVADTLGISVKTVENQMGKALKIMRAFVKENQLFIVLLILFISFIAHQA
jgi:RNA polymerase sigma-70 factor (ECF subfamily)